MHIKDYSFSKKLAGRKTIMIQQVITHQCTDCGSINLEKNGKDYKGSQKYHCLDCNKYGTLNPKPRAYPEFFKERVLRAYRERASMRGIQRIFGIARRTLARWLKEKAADLPELSQTLEPPRANDVLELDELWSFVLKKSEKRWIWIAMCRRTRQVVAYFIGDRSEKSCRKLWNRIPQNYRRCHSYSDFWEAYQKVFSSETHQSVGKESGQTNHVERWNNTLRQRLARFVRKTLSFSKSDEVHEIVLKLYLFYYNTEWCPIS
jgi:insertion element IS1 protein InsB